MNSYDELKHFLKKSKLLFEQAEPQRDDIGQSIEKNIESDTKKSSKTSQGYMVSGNPIVIHGDSVKEVKLTVFEKNSFNESVKQFKEEVTNLVEFSPMRVYQNSVEWSGKIINFNLTFIYIVGEDEGVYINGELLKLDDDMAGFLAKLKDYYSKFNQKWGSVLSERKKKESGNEK